jgi:hypothetical protein
MELFYENRSSQLVPRASCNVIYQGEVGSSQLCYLGTSIHKKVQLGRPKAVVTAAVRS